MSCARSNTPDAKIHGFRRNGANTSFLSQSGALDSLSGLTRGLVLDVNPSITQKVTGAPSASGWKYDRGSPQVGGSARWGITNTLTLNAAANPDFAEVESDAGQFVIDPRQALFFPEKRPFFLEGLDAFRTPMNLIYTRRIAQPDAALKLTGKVGGTFLGLLSAADDKSLSPSGQDRTFYNVFRALKDLGGQSRLGVAYTDRIVGSDYNRVADVDSRIVFGDVYAATLQAAGSFDKTGGVTRNAPLWGGVLSRNGKEFGFRYLFAGISEDFLARSGFISRPGVVHASIDHRGTRFGQRGSLVESLTGDFLLDDQWQYAHFFRSGDAQDKKMHFSANAGLRGGWNVGAGFYLETFSFDDKLYSGYQILAPTGDTLPFVGRPRITNHDYVFTLTTPQWKKFNGDLLYVGGHDENFYEWAQADIDLIQLGVNFRPSDRARVEGTFNYQDYWRRSDHTLVGRNMIPRVKLEYQITRAIFMRLVGEVIRPDPMICAMRRGRMSAHRRLSAGAGGSFTVAARGLFVLVPADAGDRVFPRYGSQAVGASRIRAEVQSLAAVAWSFGLFLC
jgi:hypothetical protein